MFQTPLQPRQVRLEITNYCNAHCYPCHGHGVRPMARAKGHMDWGLFKKCVEDIKGFPEPLLEVVPSNYGETFMYLRWSEALEYLAKHLPKTRMVIPTNGTLLTNGYVDKLASLDTLVLVNLSVNAYYPQTYEAFHKLPAQRLEVIERAVRLLKAKRPDVTVWISAVQDSQFQSPKEIEMFTMKWREYGFVQLNPVQYARGREPLVPVSLACRSLFSDLVVGWDGRCSSCCFDAEMEMVVGDAREEALIDIWHGSEFNRLRNLHNRGRRTEIELCRTCTFA